MYEWDTIHLQLAEEAQEDLETLGAARASGRSDGEAAGTPAPVLVAFHGADPLMRIRFRPFLRGDAMTPAIEIASLTAALGADRIAFLAHGRAWSTDDPVVPVIDGVGDLRQRVVTVHLVDATGPEETHRMLLWNVEGTKVVGPVHDVPEPGQGWVASVLIAATRREIGLDRAALVAQLARCHLLGHGCAFSPAVDRDLIVDMTALLADLGFEAAA